MADRGQERVLELTAEDVRKARLSTHPATGPDFLILGELLVRADSRIVPLPSATLRALLGALLLTAGEVVGEARLLELAWGDTGSRRALQCAVNRLRGWLGDFAGQTCRLEHAGSGYRLAVSAKAVDIVRFQELVGAASTAGDPEDRLALLATALKEWRGPVLGGRPEWLAADPAVRAIEQARIDCAASLADLALRLGRSADCVPLVSEVSALAPYDEPLQARLVRLLSMCGRHAEALRRVEEIRQRLADDLGIAPSREVREAHATALEGGERPASIPGQLPPDLPDFIGRRQEVEAIGSLLPAGQGRHGPLVFVIDGLPGAGKTALAVHVAHRSAASFVDGQLYADLRGPDTRPVDPAEVLKRFVRALGIDDAAVPPSSADLVGLYRSRTAGRRILVLLDNAVDEAQVRPLIPGAAGCAVLVTSRTCLAGLAGVRLVGLGALPHDDAVRLLGQVGGRDDLVTDRAADEIVRLCGHLPLAVRIAGARLASRPRLGPGWLAARLRDEDRRLDELAVRGLAVRPSLDLSYRDLAAAHRRTFRLLGLLGPLSFPARSAAVLLDTPLDAATRHLEALVDARLLEVVGEDAAGQVLYRFPDLVRLYARERVRAEDPGVALIAESDSRAI